MIKGTKEDVATYLISTLSVLKRIPFDYSIESNYFEFNLVYKKSINVYNII